jgi:lipoate---protein ligase
MNYCDATFPSPEENLACDEALLDLAEAGLGGEVLRFWEPARHFVVVGYANKTATEVNLPFCESNAIPVLRRCTGGGTVLQGPGVLNYSLVLRIDGAVSLQSITDTNQFILKRHQATLGALLHAPVEMRGQTDLAIGGLKFCGNAQRRKKQFLLFHGAFLLHLDIDLLEKVLPMPSKQPDYRVNRSHSDFLMNLRVPAALIKTTLIKAWNAAEPAVEIKPGEVNLLTREKYSLDEWNFKL